MRRALWTVAAVLLAAVAAPDLLRWYLMSPSKPVQGCRPCPTKERCDEGLEVSLELAPPFPRAGSDDPLWHRVRVTNRSCLRMRAFPSSDVMDSGRRMDIVIRDTSGRVVARRPPKAGSLVLYRVDAPEELYAELQPGEHVESLAATLAPYRLRHTPFSHYELYGDAHGRMVEGIREERVAAPVPPAAIPPPAGFQPLEGAWFPKPGRYSVTAHFERSLPVSVPRPRFDSLSQKLQRRLTGMGLVTSESFEPGVRAKSSAVEIRIRR